MFKAVLINIFTITMDQVAMCNMKELARSDEPTEN